MKLQKITAISVSELETLITERFGIRATVKKINGRPAIKTESHQSLFTLINAIRRDFEFEVFAKPNQGYIIYINNNLD
jgi:hypothetical protein